MPRAARPQATSIGQKGAKERLQLTSAAFVFFSLSLSLSLSPCELLITSPKGEEGCSLQKVDRLKPLAKPPSDAHPD